MVNTSTIQIAGNASKFVSEVERAESTFLQSTRTMAKAADRVDFDPASAEAQELARDVQDAADELLGLGRNAQRVGKQVDASFEDLDENLDNAASAARRFDTEVDKAGRSSKNSTVSVGGLRRAIAALVAAFATLQLARFVKESAQLAITFENLRGTATAVFGSIADGNKELERASKISEELGQDVEQVSDAYLQFQAAAKGTSIEGARSAQIFEDLVSGFTALNLSAGKTERAITAVGQVINKGKVQAEELVQQLAEAAPGALQAFADSLNVSRKELLELVAAGDVTLENLEAFASTFKEQFASGLPAAVQRTEASLNRVGNSVKLFRAEFGAAFLKEFIQGLGDAGDAFGELGVDAGQIGTIVGKTTKILINAGIAAGEVALIFGGKFTKASATAGAAISRLQLSLAIFTLRSEETKQGLRDQIAVLEALAAAADTASERGYEAFLTTLSTLDDALRDAQTSMVGLTEEQRRAEEQTVKLTESQQEQVRKFLESGAATETALNNQEKLLKAQADANKQAAEAAKEYRDSLADLTEAAAGTSPEDFLKGLEETIRLFKGAEAAGTSLLEGPLGDKFKEKVSESAEVLRVFGDQIRASLSEKDAARFDELVAKFGEVDKAVGGSAETLKKFKEAADDAFDSIKDSADEVRQSIADLVAELNTPIGDSQATEDAKKSIQDLEAEQESLRDKAIVTNKDISRQEEITRQLADANGQLRDAQREQGQATTDNAAQMELFNRIQDAANSLLNEAKGEVEGLKEEFGTYGDTAVAGAETTIEGFEKLAESGRATTADIEVFVASLEAQLEQAKRTAEQQSQAADETERLGDAFTNASDSATKGKTEVDEFGNIVQTFGEESGKAADEQERLGDEVENTGNKADETKTTLDSMFDASVGKNKELNAELETTHELLCKIVDKEGELGQ